jgi:hypothetical protein
MKKKMMSKSPDQQIVDLLAELKGATSYHDRDPLLRKLGALLKEPTTPAELLHEVALVNLGMEVNNRIAQASQASQETLAVLCKNAQHRWEWRSLWHAYRAVLNPSIDYSVIFKNKEVEVKDSAEFILNISVELTAILWQELAAHKLITFYYQQDTDDGDHFGPDDFDFDQSPAEYILSPGFEVDWVIRDEYIDSEYVSDRLADEWGSWDSSIDKIGALEYGAALGHLEPLQEDVLKGIYEQELLSVGGMEAQFIITDVEPDLPKIKKNLKNKNYEGLSDSIKHEIIVRLIDTLEHPFLGGFKISHHLLKLLLIHPATPEESKALISLVSTQLNE